MARRLRVLIIDDHPVVRAGLRQILSDAADIGSVGEAASAPEAIEGITDSFPGLVGRVDRDLRYLFASRGYERLFGLSRTAILGRTIPDVIGEEAFRRAGPYVRRVLAGEQVTFENPVTTPSGEQSIGLVTFLPEIDAEGNVRGFVIVGVDITGRRLAERALGRTAELLRLFVEHAPAGIAMMDRDMRYIAASRRYLSDYGLGDQNLIGRSHKDGSYRHILAQGSKILGDDGASIRLLGSHVDITERVQLQAQFLQAQKMESVGRLAGGIAHDFNNLLTVINGTAELTLSALREGDPLRADLEEIRLAGERAAAMTGQLLAFSRKQVQRLETLSLNALVADMQTMLRRLIGEHIDLAFVPAERGDCIRADRSQIEQVILNLAVNARDAMPDGGTLTIETRSLNIDEGHPAYHPSLQPGPYMLLAVSDTGIGMDEAVRSHIFEPFFTTKEPGRGTGRGLATVYGIAKQSGGGIWVCSEPGKGTTFKICLPRIDWKECIVGRDRAPRTARGTETILVVEDEESLRRLSNRFLSAAGYTVLLAANGGEALLLLERQEGPVHLMITDVVMPGMGGHELAERLRDVRPEMKVLFASGYADGANARNGTIGDAACFISKPYTQAELTRKVREVLDS